MILSEKATLIRNLVNQITYARELATKYRSSVYCEKEDAMTNLQTTLEWEQEENRLQLRLQEILDTVE